MKRDLKTTKNFSEFKNILCKKIIDQISTTSLSLQEILQEILEEDRSMKLNSRIFFSWLRDDPQLRDDYFLARQFQVHVLVDEIVRLSLDKNIDNKFELNRRKLAVDTVKWLAKSLMPKVYGDKVESSVTVNSHEFFIKQIE